MDTLTKDQRRKTMQAIRSKNSQIELKLGRALWAKGFRYRKNDSTVFGCPDFTFKKYKIAVFCDSEFWHGYDWGNLKNEFKSNKEYWTRKIERNIARDKKVNDKLIENGWIVLRFWGEEILKNTLKCVNLISKVFHRRNIK